VSYDRLSNAKLNYYGKYQYSALNQEKPTDIRRSKISSE